jgi:beta-galactosidase
MKPTLRTLLAALLALATLPAVAEPNHTFAIEGDHFTLDGKPFKVLSGELHYARIPREYWHARLKMARAMGLNTVATYVFWNVHEPTPNHFDFDDNNDLVAFIKAAQEEGLYVILRAGPYSCAEWEFGGFPAWLLKDPAMSTALRTNDPAFMVPAERWINRLGKEVASLQIARGGPILITQVENEYGGFHAPPDPTHAYMTHMRDIFVHAGFTDSLLDTVDGGSDLPAGGIPGVYTGVNFGVGGSKKGLDALAAFQPGKPLMVTEYWPGWFDAWGHPHETRPLDVQIADLDYILEHGSGINLYMFHGGTSFGFMSGANLNDGNYLPQVTSYDYGAPLDEAGLATPKFLAFRKIFAKYVDCSASPSIPSEKDPSSRPKRSAVGGTPHFVRTASESQANPATLTGEACLPAIPEPPPVITIPAIALNEATPIWSNLPQPIPSDIPKPMEQFDQAYGYILYRYHLPASSSGTLAIDELHDYARIFLNGKLAGTLDRRNRQSSLNISTTIPTLLDILVENSDRINFSDAMRGEVKGITKSVTLAGTPLIGWQIFPLPMTSFPNFATEKTILLNQPRNPDDDQQTPLSTPTFYRGHFTLAKAGDTFLDVRGLGKGALWINGHAIGRFWKIGPQQTLFVPGPWLHEGNNEIIVFDIAPTTSEPILAGLATPILDGPVPHSSSTSPKE